MVVRWCCLALLFAAAPVWGQEATVRSRAVVNYTFDEETGPAIDSATSGQAPNVGTLTNNLPRVPSPFWNQRGKRALQLTAAQQQCVEIADAADVDCPAGATIALFAVNLQSPNDGAYHGLFAKRGVQDGKTLTNYGINFVTQADNLQVYFNDGTGYRVANYSTKEALPYRKLVYLTATFHVGDAPGNDADADADDVRLQLFVNGKPLTPKAVTNGFVQGTEAWSVDVQVANLVNNLPVTIGRSEAVGEYFDGVVDEFSLFQQALSAEDVLRLFKEVAGNDVDQKMQEDQPAPAATPEIASITPPGWQRGTTTKVTVTGKNFSPTSTLVVSIPGVKFDIEGTPAADRITANVTVAGDIPPATYPLWVRTEQGLSAARPVAIDVLPHHPYQTATAEKPADLPAAYFGNLAGGQELKTYFRGQKGQRIVADLELRRLGGTASPVLELKTAAGTPLQIRWGQTALRGDVRIEARLPADGLYYIELHDLAYRAPGGTPFRLKLGDLRIVDLPFPAVVAKSGTVQIEPIGTGWDTGTKWDTPNPAEPERFAAIPRLPDTAGAVGPWPLLRLADSQEIVEQPAAPGSPQMLPDPLQSSSPLPLGVNGRLAKKGERDVYVLPVAAGKTYRFILQTDSLQSPLNGELSVLAHPAGNVLAATSDQPQTSDPVLDWTAPANVTAVQLAVRDLFSTGDPRNVYRIEVVPGGRQEFSLRAAASTVDVPEAGANLIELNVTRSGYNGPIALRVSGDDSLVLDPATIREGAAGRMFVRLRRTKPSTATSPLVKIIGAATGVTPPLDRAALLPGEGVSPLFADALAVGSLPPQGIALELKTIPTVLYRGATTTVPTSLVRTPGTPAAGQPARWTLRSTEAARKSQPGNPNSPDLPLIAVAAGQMTEPDVPEPTVSIQVPLDIAEKTVHLALVAETVAHAYSERVTARAVSSPFTVEIQAAVSPALEAATLSAKSEAEHAITGKLNRTAGFTLPVVATLEGLPAGYVVTPTTVPGDQSEFKLLVKAPKVDAETAVPNVKLRVTSAGSNLIGDTPVALKVVP